MNRREFLKTAATGAALAAASRVIPAAAAEPPGYGTRIAIEDGIGRVVLGEKA